MLLAVLDDIVMLALAVAVAAVLLLALLLALHVWVLRRIREDAELRPPGPAQSEVPDDSMGHERAKSR